ncbi:hypothetical protein RN001_011594 [Aquatica leii]|uniref:Uncharacterized protein n=1 Tax=Aquatica leii TaxID=1421715 RepID=A0AAN7P2K9_9COLE|nr:hypothetical protein RN001_011594 [Aquatica leii]
MTSGELEILDEYSIDPVAFGSVSVLEPGAAFAWRYPAPASVSARRVWGHVFAGKCARFRVKVIVCDAGGRWHSHQNR